MKKQGLKNHLLEQKGNTIIIVAFVLTALLGITSLVIDVGAVYLHDVKVANAVDAAALAGVQALPDSPELAYELAENYAIKNGVSAEAITIHISDDQREINVQAKREVEHFFAHVLGFSSTEVVKSAGARVGNLASAEGIVPLSIEEQELFYNEEYVLKSGAGNPGGGARHSGWFGALRLGGNGASVYENNLKNGYAAEIKIGDILEMENGNMSGPTTRGVNYRIAECCHSPACSCESYVPDCPRLVTVPVVKVRDNKTVEVKGFAKFFLERVDGQGNKNFVWGKFVRIHVPGEGIDNAEAEYGVYTARLSY
jgi:hypothetical protein